MTIYKPTRIRTKNYRIEKEEYSVMIVQIMVGVIVEVIDYYTPHKNNCQKI